MNRSNVGNVITNGMQIMSVAGNTAARQLGHAESALNNLSLSEKADYGAMQADNIRERIEKWKNPDSDNDNTTRTISKEAKSKLFYKKVLNVESGQSKYIENKIILDAKFNEERNKNSIIGGI